VSLIAATTTYAAHFTKAPRGHHHPDIPALLVALQFLNSDEGYMWVSCSTYHPELGLTQTMSSGVLEDLALRMVLASTTTATLATSPSIYQKYFSHIFNWAR
jgi:hypothetical protein